MQNDDGHLQSAAPLKTSQKYRAGHTKRLSTRYQTRLNVTKCHACHAKRSNATLETSKNDLFCRTYNRHGHTALTRTVADGCERSQTVADGWATSSEHTLNPQTPRVKQTLATHSAKTIKNSIDMEAIGNLCISTRYIQLYIHISHIYIIYIYIY